MANVHASASQHMYSSATAHPDHDVTLSRHAHEAYGLLHLAFVIAPVVAGLDKFFHLLTDWDKYVAPVVARALPMSVHTFMSVVGVIEIAAGLLVLFRPRLGAYVVAAWLVGIVLNLVLTGGYLDIALRDVGLFLGALALARLSLEHDKKARAPRGLRAER
jgi:uncharacterized membrane protein YphA (DoxX/SURF4 family)